ncbi:MAG: SAM-dependent methyltransferase [Elusimicrobia bacterium RIFOXYD2_FULL_34_15]|nr:MAG: SAM-dependent methyltransferase [Elusimicrobia bacterium RIFOXYD2_FULL_34_15]
MDKCRVCGSKLTKPFLSLGNSPVSNAYLTKDDLNRMEPFYPLDVYICNGCLLVQIDEFETAKNIFTVDYAYFSSYSESWLKHCSDYTEMMIERFGFDKKSFVVEIGSNDGYLLQYFKQHDIPVLGVEPSAGTAKVAIKKGIPTDISFFSALYAKKIGKNGKLADLIIGNNVLAHNPNLNDFVEGLKIALNSRGIITIEVPHMLRIIQDNQFDTIYHEHFSYFSFYSLKNLFALHGLEVFDVEELYTHGGSLRIFAKHKNDKTKKVSKRVSDLLKKEKSAGLYDLKTYFKFGNKVEITKRKLLKFLIQAKNEGKKIVGYGAPAKGNTLLNYCGIRTDFIDYTVDRNPFKQNKYLPGTHIPIKHPDKIKQDKPDYVLILPWNIREEIMKQMAYIRKWGGKFIEPIPEVVVFR